LNAALGVDIDKPQGVLIENLFDLDYRGAFVGVFNCVIDLIPLGRRERLTQVLERTLDLSNLQNKRLEWYVGRDNDWRLV
jgi:hypothetical protein